MLILNAFFFFLLLVIWGRNFHAVIGPPRTSSSTRAIANGNRTQTKPPKTREGTNLK